MRLSDFKGGDALDLMADILEPITKVLSDPKTKELRNNRVKLIQHILRSHKEETLDVYHILYGESKEEATPVDLVRMVVEFLSDPELKDLFSLQGQNEGADYSGSATENTEDGAK